MKTCIKTVALALVGALVLSNSFVTFAASNKSNEVTSSKSIVTKYSNEDSKSVWGTNSLQIFAKSNKKFIPQWTSGGADHTHQYILQNAIKILENDKGTNVSQYFYSTGSDELLEGADAPDKDENDVFTFCGHFYNPDTGKNFLGQTEPTALSRAIEHASLAKENYWNDRSSAMEELGRSIHYIEDANESHHASNSIAVLTNHSEYEKWVDSRRTNYVVSSSNLYTYLTPSDLDTDFSTYVSNITKESATYAKSYKDLATDKGDSKYTNWDTAANATMKHAQKIVAAYLYNFLKSVGQI